RDATVTGVQTCALPISSSGLFVGRLNGGEPWDQEATIDGANLSPVAFGPGIMGQMIVPTFAVQEFQVIGNNPEAQDGRSSSGAEIGRASCREREQSACG